MHPYYTQQNDDYKTWWTAALALLMVPLSLFVMITFIFSSDFLGMGERSPKAMMEGFALKPHVYRQLVPVMARGIIAFTPTSLERAITDDLSVSLWDNKLFSQAVKQRHRGGTPLELADSQLYPFFIICVLDWLFLLGYAYMLWQLAKNLFPDHFSIHILAPLFGLLALPPFCGKYGYIYDFPVLFLTAWLTLLIVQQRWIMYCFVFALATFNKETTLYVFMAFALYGYRELPRKSWLFYTAIQLVIFSIIKLLLAIYFEGAGGAMLEYRGIYGHLRANLDGYSVYTLLGLGAALALFSYRWEEKPLLLKCWVGTIPFMILAWLMFGNRNEYRVFYDIFPALTLLASHTLATALQWKTTAKRNHF